MNRKIILISTLIIIIIAATTLSLNKKSGDIVAVEGTAPRNDTFAQEEATTTEVVIKSYSLAEIALHDKKDDCWLVIEGNVIDPTEFIAKGLHPNDKILNGCGKDATSMFEAERKHNGGKAQMALMQYKIGVLK